MQYVLNTHHNRRFLSFRSLEQLLVSLQWGRQQTYYPSAQPLSTGELAVANHKLAEAINSHLLGNTNSSSSSNVVKGSSTTEQLCSTPAEKMAEKVQGLYLTLGLMFVQLKFTDQQMCCFFWQVLKILDPISCSENKADPALNDSAASNFLNSKKSIGRFHPYTRYENITFNCCERCTGDILVL